MKNKNAINENMHALLECLFVLYANELRTKYPDQTIRNSAVFRSGVPEFARLGFIQLVDARKGIPEVFGSVSCAQSDAQNTSRSGFQVQTFPTILWKSTI